MSTGHHTSKFNTFICILIDILRTVAQHDRRQKSYIWYLHVLRRNALLFSFSERELLTSLNTAGGYHNSVITHIPILRLSLFIHHYLWTSTMPPNISTCSATDASVFGIREYYVVAVQPAPVPSTHAAISWHTNSLPPLFCIDGSNISALHRKAAAIKPQFLIWDLGIWNTS